MGVQNALSGKAFIAFIAFEVFLLAMRKQMRLESAFLRKSTITFVADEWFFLQMTILVIPQVRLGSVGSRTNVTLVRTICSMCGKDVGLQGLRLGEPFSALITRVRSLIAVRSGMYMQVAYVGECFHANLLEFYEIASVTLINDVVYIQHTWQT